MRVYDPRVGRFLSNDPLSKKYPYLTSYQFASSKPTKYVDIDGAESEGENEEELRSPEEIEEQAEQIRENAREYEREREERERERYERRMKNDPTFRANQELLGRAAKVLGQYTARESYWNNALQAARFILTPGNVYENKRNGDTWDDMVKDEMLKNPDCVGVGRQISIKVVGVVNGKTEVANVRIDNVGVRIVDGKPVFDFKEAKFSIGEIKDDNVLQVLTPQQKAAVNILINGSNVDIMLRGEISTQRLNTILNTNNAAYKLSNGQSILGHIGEVKIVVPAGRPSATSSTSANGAASSSQQTQPNGQQTTRQQATTGNSTPQHH
jgi:hypothetical protein